MPRTRVKVCCIASWAEARTAIDHGADALGLVSAMPSGPGVIEEGLIEQIAGRVPPPIATFLLTSSQDAEAIIRQVEGAGVSTVQLVDEIPMADYAHLRRALPGRRIVQVIHVTDEGAVREAERIAPHVDALLLDSGNPALAVKELGGTGRTHDWALSRRIRERAEVPVFLAGGLHAGNVAEAIRVVEPFGVDLCSGVRTEGRLDAEKLRTFMAAVRGQ